VKAFLTYQQAQGAQSGKLLLALVSTLFLGSESRRHIPQKSMFQISSPLFLILIRLSSEFFISARFREHVANGK
jgi:hypothetical protein